MKGKFNLIEKFKEVGTRHCFISEITLAELKFGVQNSQSVEKNAIALLKFLKELQILPIINSLDIYASEKARLRKVATPISDFDLLIGATAVANEMIMVTNNHREFSRIKGIKLEDWTRIA
jgi:tRNA(fMet)-specific endonuclease VapC